jgi:hypothetical protein
MLAWVCFAVPETARQIGDLPGAHHHPVGVLVCVWSGGE